MCLCMYMFVKILIFNLSYSYQFYLHHFKKTLTNPKKKTCKYMLMFLFLFFCKVFQGFSKFPCLKMLKGAVRLNFPIFLWLMNTRAYFKTQIVFQMLNSTWKWQEIYSNGWWTDFQSVNASWCTISILTT